MYEPERAIDPPAPRVKCICSECDKEIYEGEEYFEVPTIYPVANKILCWWCGRSVEGAQSRY